LRKSENDTLIVRSVKNSKSLLECPTITAFVAVLDAKAFSCTDLLKSYIAGENRILTVASKPTEIATTEIFDKTHGLRFLEESHLFFLICDLKTNKRTAPHLCSVWRLKILKHNVRTTLQVAYHGCKNLTRSKTRQVKRTQMVATVRFMICVFLTFSDWRESNATKLSRE